MMKNFQYPFQSKVVDIFFESRTPNSKVLDTCTHVYLTNVNNEWNPSTVKLPNGNKKYKHHCSQLHILCSTLHNTIYYSNNTNLQISKLTTNNEIDVNTKHSFVTQKNMGI